MMGTPIRRRSRDTGWQWLMIGMALGVGCSMVVCLTSYVAGFIEAGTVFTDATEAPAVAVVNTVAVTATDPASPTPGPSTEEVVEAPAATDENSEAPGENLGGGESGQATPLPSSNDNGQAGGTDEAIGGTPADFFAVGTAVPVEGAPSVTPGIGSAPAVPETLAQIASPMQNITGGTFTMGTTRDEALAAVDQCRVRDGKNCDETMVQDSIPTHSATVDDFQMEIYEVSTLQYVAFLNALAEQSPAGIRVDKVGCDGGPCILTVDDDPQSRVRYNPESQQFEIVNPDFYSNHPIVYVTWAGAKEYCEALGRRLPTEAEWERAARGPANSIYPWGQQWVPTNANTSYPTAENTMSVESFPSAVNAYGLYNIAGNASEWVHDFYDPNWYSNPLASEQNTRGPQFSDRRVARGGGWDNAPLFARTVHRIDIPPGDARGSVGFRCAADL